ncbi:MAG: UrcA family protein [Sphingomonas sp.]
MKQTLKIIAASAIATAALLKGIPAAAQPAAVQNVSVVRTADLDLTRQAGRTALEHRLVVAAYEVCGTASNADLAGENQVRACRSEVLQHARAATQQLASRKSSILIAAAR